VRGVEAFDPEAMIRGARLQVTVEDEAALAGLKEVLEAHQGGEGRVTLKICTSRERAVEIALDQPCDVTPALQAALKTCPGVNEARITYR